MTCPECGQIFRAEDEAQAIIDAERAKYEKLRSLYDQACRELGVATTDNDGGPDNLAEVIRDWKHNLTVSVPAMEYTEGCAAAAKEYQKQQAVIDEAAGLLGRAHHMLQKSAYGCDQNDDMDAMLAFIAEHGKEGSEK